MKLPLFFGILFFLFSGTGAGLAEDIPPSFIPPKIMREFRGAWIASVGNIDWPSKPGLSTADQQKELLALLDRAAQLKLNAVILQVRPSCDALYHSRYEPWSEYLSGVMGTPPSPYYDPLAFAISAAHERGLELHAWFNPYRAGHPSAKSNFSANHISKLRPEFVRAYGKYLWLDPGEPGVQTYTTAVIMDVVRRYDVDGVHLDDYFYPYKERDKRGNLIDFPDDATWKRYSARGGKLDRADWRRDNVNHLVQTLYASIKREKPWVKFGISPFGIWRPGFPAQVTGLDAYDHLYADSRLWLRNSWVDYLAPQLYWAVAPPAQSFPALLKWWVSQNEAQRHIWPGCASSKVGTAWGSGEILNQINIARSCCVSPGHILWNMGSLMRNATGLGEALSGKAYGETALVPACPWLEKSPPAKPALRLVPDDQNRLVIAWTNATPEKNWRWAVQIKRGDVWTTETLAGKHQAIAFEASARRPDAVALTAISRCGLASPAGLLIVPSEPPKTGITQKVAARTGADTKTASAQ